VGDWTEKRKTVMLLSNGKRIIIIIIIIIKVKVDVSKKKKEKGRPVIPAGMTPNSLQNIKVRKSEHLVRSPRRGSVPRPTTD
jgi:hypothetical protein